MAWIKKRDDKHQVLWRDLSGKECARTCPTLRAARDLKLEVEEALARGRNWQPEITGSEPLIEEISVAYVEQRALTKRADTLRMDGTYLDVFRRFCATKSKRPTVSILSRPLLDEYVAWLAKPETSVHRKPRAQVTIAKFVRAAQQMWSWAEDSDRWPGVVPRPRLIDLPDSRPQPVVAPTWTEMSACVRACKTENLRKLATWLRYTGLRVGESMLFTWDDLDMQRGELMIRPEVDKTGVGRVVPLCNLILDEIATWGRREGYLIPSSRKPGIREREARGRDMTRAWQRAGVRPAVWRRRPDHAFRKGFKSELLASGAHADAVDYLQGHSLGAGSRGRYIDPTRLPLRKALDLIPPIGPAEGNIIALPSAHPADKERTSRQGRSANRS